MQVRTDSRSQYVITETKVDLEPRCVQTLHGQYGGLSGTVRNKIETAKDTRTAEVS